MNVNVNVNVRSFLPLALLLLVGGCESVQLPGAPPPATPHEAYAYALERSGLYDTALGREWIGAADAALRTPLRVTLPIEEAGYLPPDRPRAVAYQVNLVRGRRLVLQAELTPAPGALLFIDVYAVSETAGDSLRHVVAADSGTRTLAFEPRRTGDYVIRVQPELLRGGRYLLKLHAEPALAFPVQGAANPAIQSGFGAARDGGAREHHGIDIFAPRGTPVLAAAAGVVTRVQETARGGRVVWVRDERRGISLYFAHLDRQLVERGATVQVGDTLGLVGNSGNARGTPPHLHFGIYRRGEGALDPRTWVARVNTQPVPVRADTSLLGTWARTRRSTALQVAPDAKATRLRVLESETMLRVLSAQADWYQVRLPDGTSGFLPTSDAVAARQPLRVRVLTAATPLLAQPTQHAAIIDTLNAGNLRVYGRFGDKLFVEAANFFGWVREMDEQE